MTQVVLLLRSLLFYLGYGFFTLLLSLLFFVLVWFLPDSRRHWFTVLWSRLILMWFRISCGVKYAVHGLDNIPSQPVVVLANHQSEWETIFLYRYLAPICPILKKELLDIPFYGWAMRMIKPIAIDRSKPREAGRSILTQGKARIRDGRSVIIFPEGTRTPAGQVGKFSRGGVRLAVAAGVPVLPVAHNAGHCWPARRFVKRPGTVTVHIGKPLDTEGVEDTALTHQVETWVRQHVVGDGDR